MVDVESGKAPRGRVLVVDDDPLVLSAVVRKLHLLGYEADAAAGHEDALALASLSEYDVALIDFVMQVNGLTLIASLAERSLVTSFILMTGARDLPQQGSHLVDERLTTVLHKPFDDTDLDNALKHAMNSSVRRRSQRQGKEPSISVLLLEDSQSDAFLLKYLLQNAGNYEVTHFTKLADAVRALHSTQFDTVITDLTLPDARGLAAVTRLRECAPNSTLVVCSAIADDALALQVIELGAQDYIIKGSYQDGLARAIRFARVRRRAEVRLARLANTDGLTGLTNRAAFSEALERALARAKRESTPVGVLYVDLDGFKAVNDAQGHDAGDALLKEVSARLRGSVREEDLVARLGGDEFALLTFEAQPGLQSLAQRITQVIAQPFILPSGSAHVSASIGYAHFPDAPGVASRLLKLADDAMYAAKRAKKGSPRPISV